MKKIFICIFLCFSLIITTNAVFAFQTTSNFQTQANNYLKSCIYDLVTLLANNSSQYKISPTDIRSSYVSKPISIDNSTDNTLYYSIVNGNKVIGIITVWKYNNTFSLKYSNEYTDIFTSVLCSNEQVNLAWDTDSKLIINENITSAQSQNFLRSNLREPLVSSAEINRFINNTDNTRSTTFSSSASLSGTFPVELMESSGCCCSIACATAMTEYAVPSLNYLTTSSVVQTVYGYSIPCGRSNFNPLQRAPEVFDYYAPAPYMRYNRYLNIEEIYSQFNSNNPIMAISNRYDTTEFYHATAITSYNYGVGSQSYMVTMMDPTPGTFVIVFWDGYNAFTYPIGNYLFVWQESIVLYTW